MDLPQIICLAIFGGVPVWSLEKNTSSYSVFALEATAFTVKSRSQIGMPQKIPMRLEQHLGMISMATKATATTAKQEQTHLRSSPSPPPTTTTTTTATTTTTVMSTMPTETTTRTWKREQQRQRTILSQMLTTTYP